MKTRSIILGTLALSAGSALATPIYSTGFEGSWGSDDAVWSDTTRVNLGRPYTHVLGNYGTMTVGFDLMATEANTSGLLGGGGSPGGGQFNIGVEEFIHSGKHKPVADTSPGVGDNPSDGSSGPGDGPRLNLGGAISDGSGQGNDGPPMFGPGTYALTFDLMLFDSWDADHEGYGPDSIAVSVNGEVLFDELFESQWLPNNFRLPDELPRENVFHQNWQDMIYRDITVTFSVTEAMSLFSFAFIGTTSEVLIDESWGLDNVRVSQIAGGRSLEVPAPGVLTLLGSGLGLISIRTRRR